MFSSKVRLPARCIFCNISKCVSLNAKVRNNQTGLQKNIENNCVTENILSFDMKSTKDLLRTWWILKLSSINAFVDHSETVLNISKRLTSKQFFEAVLKATFYGQFVGGESVEELRISVEKLRNSGIRSMLCIPIETAADGEQKSEDTWSANSRLVHECIKTTEELEKGGFSQVKLTALCSVDLLRNMNEHLLPYEYKHEEPNEWSIRRVGNLLKTERYEDITIPSFSAERNIELRETLQRIDQLAKACKENGLRFMLDAEQTYIQSALGYLILLLQHKYNSEIPVVYNTYQCYRKDTLRRIHADYNLSKENNFKVACKLVRGAYMEEERRIAHEQGVADPINDGCEKTTEVYHAAVDFMLPLVKANQVGLVVASHNEDTVMYVLNRMTELGLRGHKGFSFAQLYGMCDHVTEGLAKAGCEVFKSVPYGSVDCTLLYLSRRARENKSVMERSVTEREKIMGEIIRRAKYPQKTPTAYTFKTFSKKM